MALIDKLLGKPVRDKIVYFPPVPSAVIFQIDAALAGLGSRSIMPVRDVANILLDIRSALLPAAIDPTDTGTVIVVSADEQDRATSSLLEASASAA